VQFDESYDDQYGGPKADEEAVFTNDERGESVSAEVLPIAAEVEAEQNSSSQQGGSVNQGDNSSNASDKEGD
jgi:hypothetical protein